MFKIEKHTIGPDSPPFIIAEMSGNHNGSLEAALKIVDAVAKTGCQALKLQTYTADTMTLPLKTKEFWIDEPTSLWKGSSLYDLYQKAHTPWEWHKPIFDRCRQLGITAFSTPFDDSAVDFLETLNVPAYKIASFEACDLNLIRAVAKTGKPLIISTGMASLAEIQESVDAARSAGAKQLALLKCTSAYPSPHEGSNLRTIPNLREVFGLEVGLSDHTMGIAAPIAAVAFGATIIEKHVTLSRAEGGVDADFSLEPAELTALVVESERARKSLGKISYGMLPEERSSQQFRRSLYIAKAMKKGEVLSKENLRRIRPGFGLAPKYFDSVLGMAVKRDVEAGTPLSWELVR